MGKKILKKGACITIFIAVLFTIGKIWQQTKCPLTNEIIKTWYTFTMEYHLAIEENAILSFATM